MQDLIKYTDNINKLLARFGVKFGIYKNNVFHEQLFPFDAIPRVITAKEFDEMEKGLVPVSYTHLTLPTICSV